MTSFEHVVSLFLDITRFVFDVISGFDSNLTDFKRLRTNMAEVERINHSLKF